MSRDGDGELIACAGAQPCKSAVAAARAVAGLCSESLSSMSASILLCLVMEPFETDDLKVCWCCLCLATCANFRLPGLEEHLGRHQRGSVYRPRPAQCLPARRHHPQQNRHGA